MAEMVVDNTAFDILAGEPVVACQDLLEYLWEKYVQHVDTQLTQKRASGVVVPKLAAVADAIPAKAFLVWAGDFLRKKPPVSFQMSSGLAILRLTDSTNVSIGATTTEKPTQTSLRII